MTSTTITLKVPPNDTFLLEDFADKAIEYLEKIVVVQVDKKSTPRAKRAAEPTDKEPINKRTRVEDRRLAPETFIKRNVSRGKNQLARRDYKNALKNFNNALKRALNRNVSPEFLAEIEELIEKAKKSGK